MRASSQTVYDRSDSEKDAYSARGITGIDTDRAERIKGPTA